MDENVNVGDVPEVAPVEEAAPEAVEEAPAAEDGAPEAGAPETLTVGG